MSRRAVGDRDLMRYKPRRPVSTPNKTTRPPRIPPEPDPAPPHAPARGVLTHAPLGPEPTGSGPRTQASQLRRPPPPRARGPPLGSKLPKLVDTAPRPRSKAPKDPNAFVCPLCSTRAAFKTKKRIRDHMAKYHCSAAEAVRLPPAFLQRLNWSWCFDCKCYQRYDRPHSKHGHSCGRACDPDALQAHFRARFPDVHVPLEEPTAPPLREHAAEEQTRRAKKIYRFLSTIDLAKMLQFRPKFYIDLPRAAQFHFCQALRSSMDYVLVDSTDPVRWVPMMMLCRWVLRRPSRAGSARRKRSLSQLQARLEAFYKGEYEGLHEHWMRSCQEERSKEPRAAPNDQVRAMSKRLIRRGKLSQALKTLDQQGLAPTDDVTLRLLQLKHPRGEAPRERPHNQDAIREFSIDDVDEQIKRMNKKSAAGPSGIHTRHLQMCWELNPGFPPKITALVNLMFLNQVPAEIQPLLAGANLTALSKKVKSRKHTGPKKPLSKMTIQDIKSTLSRDVRPIAVGEVLRRLVSGLAVKTAMPKAKRLFEPIQLGVGVKGGCEALVHAIRERYERPTSPSSVLIQLDLMNAFNIVSRDKILGQVAAHLPSIYPWVNFLYSNPSRLFWQDQVILSRAGVAQGDPLGPLLFALVFQPLLGYLKQELNPGLIGAYLDDCTLELPIAEVPRLLDIMQSRQLREIGLCLNLSKCCVLVPQQSSIRPEQLDLLPHELEVTRNGAVFLGSPIGIASFCRQFCQTTVKSCIKLIEKVQSLEDLQLEYQLYNNSVNHMRLTYLWRTTPPELVCVSRWKKAQQQVLKRLCMSVEQLPEHAQRQACFGIRYGGLALRGSQELATICYLASTSQFAELISRTLSLENWTPTDHVAHTQMVANLMSEPGTVEAILGNYAKIQRSLTQAMDEYSLKRLAHQFAKKTRDYRRLTLFRSHDNMSAWLMAVPDRGRSLALSSKQFAMGLRYRLGVPIIARPTQCSKCVKYPHDRYGDHVLHCKSSPLKTRRHNAIRNLFARYGQAGGLSIQIEAENILPAEGQGVPADLLYTTQNGEQTAYDISIVSPFSTMIRQDASNVFDLHERKKRDRYKVGDDGLLNPTTRFEPLIITTYGSPSKQTQAFIKHLAKASHIQWDLSPEVIAQQLRQQLSVLVIKFNANAHLYARSSLFEPKHDLFLTFDQVG